jgi:hypothetical protein
MLARARRLGYVARALEAIEVPSRMAAAEVIERLSALARADLGEHLEYDAHGVVVGPRVVRGQTYTLLEYATTGKSGVRVRVESRRQALEALARIYGLDGTRGADDPTVNRMRAGLLALLADPVRREQLRALSLAALEAQAQDRGQAQGPLVDLVQAPMNGTNKQ